MTDEELDDLMKRCQRGTARWQTDEANSLHADCYGAIGWLRHELSKHGKAEVQDSGHPDQNRS